MKILKISIIFIIFLFSSFIWYKSYIILDFTLWNTLNWIYTSYLYTEKGVSLVSDTVKSVSTSVKELVWNQTKESKIEVIKKDREQEIYYTRLVINLLPVLISFILAYKIFTFISWLIVDSSTNIRKIFIWINWIK